MPRYNNYKIWFTAFLLLMFGAGCSDPDKTAGNRGVTPPTVISVTPPNLAGGICPDTVVVATFSEAMNPSTINATTFTLTSRHSMPWQEQLPTMWQAMSRPSHQTTLSH